jgi:hypothetical protein
LKGLNEQIPVEHAVQKRTGLRHERSADNLYAIMRRLGERITDLERREGENRRDISRIEQRQRRASLNEPPQQPPGVANNELEKMFGLGA